MTIKDVFDNAKAEPLLLDLLPDAENGGKICPHHDCDGGRGNSKTGATKFTVGGRELLGCFKCKAANRNGNFSNVDIAAYHLGIPVTGAPYSGADASKIAKFLADHYGWQLDGYTSPVAVPRDIPPSTVNHDADAALKAKTKENIAADIAKYLANPTPVPPQFARAITPEMYERFHVVYDPKWTTPLSRAKGTFCTPTARIIFICGNFYFARLANRIEDYAPESHKYIHRVENAGEVEIFNGDILDTADVTHIYVFEGAFDALSLMQATGLEAVVAIHGTPHWRKLLKKIMARSDGGKNLAVNIVFDDDNSGRTVAKEFQRACIANGIPAIAVTLPRAAGDTSCEKVDANQILQKFGAEALRESFLCALKDSGDKFAAVEEEIAHRADSATPPNSDISTSTSEVPAVAVEDKIEIAPGVISLGRYALKEFFAEIERDAQFAARKTGFANIDSRAAFLPGVGFLGGGTGAGKSDFVIQLLDQICTAGLYGLYLPLELPKKAVQSRIYARRLYLKTKEPESPPASYIRTHGNSMDLRAKLEETAREFYAQVGDRLEVDNDISFTSEQLREKIERYCARVPVPPVIALDYLQLVDFTGERERRVAIDKLSRELKKVQMNTDATIIAVSSVNRAAYKLAAENSALKESGGLEFNADFIWILQLSIIEDSEEPVTVKQLDEAACQIPRQISLKCTKNRDALPFSARFDYFSGHSYFAPFSNNHGAYDRDRNV